MPQARSGLLKWLEHRILIFQGNSRPGIRNRQHGHRAFGRQTEGEFPTPRHRLEPVAGEIQHRQPQLSRTADNFDRIV